MSKASLERCRASHAAKLALWAESDRLKNEHAAMLAAMTDKQRQKYEDDRAPTREDRERWAMEDAAAATKAMHPTLEAVLGFLLFLFLAASGSAFTFGVY